jgi:hypothetical protein
VLSSVWYSIFQLDQHYPEETLRERGVSVILRKLTKFSSVYISYCTWSINVSSFLVSVNVPSSRK